VLKRERQVLVKEKAWTKAGAFSPSRHSASALRTTTLASTHINTINKIVSVGREDLDSYIKKSTQKKYMFLKAYQ
jgi:hypothetical protein